MSHLSYFEDWGLVIHLGQNIWLAHGTLRLVRAHRSKRAKAVQLADATHSVAKESSVFIESPKDGPKEGHEGVFEVFFNLLQFLCQILKGRGHIPFLPFHFPALDVLVFIDFEIVWEFEL